MFASIVKPKLSAIESNLQEVECEKDFSFGVISKVISSLFIENLPERIAKLATSGETGKIQYLNACSALNVRPCNQLLYNIGRELVNLQHAGVGTAGAQALAECLKV